MATPVLFSASASESNFLCRLRDLFGPPGVPFDEDDVASADLKRKEATDRLTTHHNIRPWCDFHDTTHTKTARQR